MTLDKKAKNRIKGLYKDHRKQMLVGRVVKLHIKGYTNKKISEMLNVSEDFVETFVTVYEDNKDRLNKEES